MSKQPESRYLSAAAERRATRIQDLFHEALEQPPAQRTEWLARTCGSDEPLRAEVESLLRADARRGSASAAADTRAPSAASAAGLWAAGALPAAARIGSYEVVRLIAAGGMGAVYEALQQNPRRTVALKLLRPGFCGEEALRRFRYEGELLGRLRHPGVAQIYEAGLHEQAGALLPFLAMEYIAGECTVREFARKQQLSPRARLVLLRRIADAVHHGHVNGVIHRDLKPDNVLVDPSGQPKLIDFGVARAIDPGALTMQTAAGQLVGTIAYMSPEQVGGAAHQLDARSDVYSLGVLGFELLAGQLPYDLRNCSIAEAARIIRDVDPLPLGALQRGLRGDVEVIIATALEKDPARRYQSASEFAADIQRYLQNEPLLARPTNVGYRIGKFVRRNRVGVIAASVALLGLVGGAAGALWQAYRATQQRDLARAAELHAELETAKARRIAELLERILSSADPAGVGGERLTVRQVLDQTSRNIERETLEDPLVIAAVRHVIGKTYYSLTAYDAAIPHLQAALKLRREKLGDDPLVAETLSALGLAQLDSGRAAESEANLQEALRLARRVFGPEHWQVASAMQNMGLHRRNFGNPREAEVLYRDATELRRRNPQTPPAELVSSLTSLGDLLREMNRLDEAEALLREALDIQRAHARGPHPETAICMNNLALLLQARRNHAEAEQLLRDAVDLSAALRDATHMTTLRFQNNLAALLGEIGRHAEAEQLHRHVLNVRKQQVGEDHPETITSLNNLAVTLSFQQDHEGAAALYVEIIERARRVLGEDHPSLGATLYSLARVHARGGRYELAEPLLREALAIHIRAIGPEHWRTAQLRGELGSALFQLGQLVEAEALLIEAFEQLMSERGPRDARTVKTAMRIGRLYRALGQPELADCYERQTPESLRQKDTSDP